MADLTIQEKEILRVNEIAKAYQEKGYDVLLQPREHQLPDFLKQFQPDLIVHKGNEHIVVEVKSRGQFSQSLQVNELAKIVRNETGWKFELVLLGPENALSVGEASPLTAAEIRSKILEATSFLSGGHLDVALLIGWSLVEATLRTLALKEGIEAEKAVSAYLLKQMTYEGVISRDAYRFLLDIQQTRNAIAHGFKPPQLKVETVKALIDFVENELLQEVDR